MRPPRRPISSCSVRVSRMGASRPRARSATVRGAWCASSCNASSTARPRWSSWVGASSTGAGRSTRPSLRRYATRSRGARARCTSHPVYRLLPAAHPRRDALLPGPRPSLSDQEQTAGERSPARGGYKPVRARAGTAGAPASPRSIGRGAGGAQRLIVVTLLTVLVIQLPDSYVRRRHWGSRSPTPMPSGSTRTGPCSHPTLGASSSHSRRG